MNFHKRYSLAPCILTLLFSTHSIAVEYSASISTTTAEPITPDAITPGSIAADTVKPENALPVDLLHNKIQRVEQPQKESAADKKPVDNALLDTVKHDANNILPDADLPDTVLPADTAQPEPVKSVDTITDELLPDPVEQVCNRIANKLSSVSLDECLQRELKASNAFSEKLTPLLIKEYPPLGERIPQARILVLGGVHGDEYSSVTITFKWMQTLDKYHSGLFHWKVTPLVNPDGLLQKKSQRMNANGVDLNRNFKNGIGEDASLEYWRKRTYEDPRRYPGHTPVSESETQWVQQLIEEFKPDAIVAIHAPYGIVDFDGPDQPPKHLGPLHLHLLGTYPGSLGNYAGIQLNIPVVTVELPHAGIMPSDSEIRRIWVDLIGWLRNHIPQQNKLADSNITSD